MKHRNTSFLIEHSINNYQAAVAAKLMQVTIQSRNGKEVTMPNKSQLIELLTARI